MRGIEDIIKLKDSNCNPKDVNPTVLAYLGDGIYELFVRDMVVQTGASKVQTLHKLSVQFVKASSQAKALKLIQEVLDEEELGVVRRARNHKTLSMPKNAKIMEYKMATAFEALLGYLYLLQKKERLEELMNKSIKALIEEQKA